MEKKPTRRPTLTTALAVVALIVASGGTAYAAATIGSAQIIDDSIRSVDIKNGHVKSADIGDGQVTSPDIKNGQVKSADIGDGQVTSPDIKNGQVGTADIGDGQVQSVDVKNGSLQAADMAPGALADAVTQPLPSGRTVRGTLGIQDNGLLTNQELAINASMPVAAPVALDDAHVTVDGSDEPVAECAGTAANPTAAPGYVCIYPWFASNVLASPTGHIWGSDVSANTRYGFQISLRAAADGRVTYFANWAYTAP